MATESTKEHEKIKALLQKKIPFAIQQFNKRPLYRALGHSYKIFPCISVHFHGNNNFSI